MRKLLVTSVVAVLLLAGLVGASSLLTGQEPRRLSVLFPSTTSLYEGAQVKVLGVRVGTQLRNAPCTPRMRWLP